MHCPNIVTCVSTVASFYLVGCLQLFAADPDSNSRMAASKLVGEALRAEMRGELLARQRLLQEAYLVDSNYPAHQWFRGRILANDGGWLTIDQVIGEAASSKLLHVYESTRASHNDDVLGNWKMARWCAQNGLADQCRAHLLNVVLHDPEHSGARAALGHISVGGNWLTPEDRLDMGNRIQRTREGFSKYADQITRLLRLAEDTDNKANRDAFDQLGKIRDPLSVSVMEAAIDGASHSTAIFIVSWLAKIDHPDATIALSRLAVYHTDATVRLSAIESLQSRCFFDFIPQMLDAMSSPIAFMTLPATDSGGRFIGLRQAFMREGMHDNRIWNIDSLLNYYEPQQRLPTTLMVTSWENSRFEPSVGAYASTKVETLNHVRDLAEMENAMNQAAAAHALVATNAAREAMATAENRFIKENNRRIADAISQITGARFEVVPRDVWKWWDNYNETDYQRSKFKRRRYHYPQFVARIYHDYVLEPYATRKSTVYGSCFVQGTKVATLRGPMAIELIAPGDLVLSRNVSTGELSFKPVVAATTRTPAKTVELTVNDEQLRATTSHLLWVSGKGWTKAGDLRPGDILHSAAEPAVVIDNSPGDTLPTHNLVVADNHTYFVGSALVLSHDVLPRGPTQENIPGQFEFCKTASDGSSIGPE